MTLIKCPKASSQDLKTWYSVDGNNFHLKGNGVIRHNNSFGPENAGNIKDIPPSSVIHRNIHQRNFFLY